MTPGAQKDRPGFALLWHPAGTVAARLLLAGVLLYAGLAKVGHTRELARIVFGYRLLHPELLNLVAMTLPWLELLTGLLLVVGLLRSSAAAVAGGLFFAFMLAAGLAMARHLDVPCGCFSVTWTSERVGWGLLVRDGVLALLSGFLLLHPSHFLEMDALLTRPRHAAVAPSQELPSAP